MKHDSNEIPEKQKLKNVLKYRKNISFVPYYFILITIIQAIAIVALFI